MNQPYLHIICLDVPYPVDYGGVFDLYYKLPALKAQGVKILLHCFEYGRGQQSKLNTYCEQVYYYPRNKNWNQFISPLPYIVQSRNNPLLLRRLLEDRFPILSEGIHCSGFLYANQLPADRCLIRHHNVEFLYYHHLAKTTSFLPKKLYYLAESQKLKRYETSLANQRFVAVSQTDVAFCRNQLQYQHIEHLPLFLGNRTIANLSEWGDYCLYQGNLSVAENAQAVVWLLEEVFSKIDYPLIIAGKNPDSTLKKKIANRKNTRLIENLSDADMQALLSNAQVNLLPSLNKTGIKLKLIQALYGSRHCVVNEAGVDGPALGALCHIALDAAHFAQLVAACFKQPYKQQDIQQRTEVLPALFNDEAHAKRLIELLRL